MLPWIRGAGSIIRGGFGHPFFLLLAVVCRLAAAEDSNTIRFATFNASLNREASGELSRDLAPANDSQATAVAAIVRTIRPDVLLLNEFDYDMAGQAAASFRRHYLEAPRLDSATRATEPIAYRYVYVARSNTGVATGFDLNRDGRVGGAEDARGFGQFEGQYGMVLFSRFPIDTARIRSFQNFLWRDMPDALLPDDIATAAPNDWYSAAALGQLPLSSKNHIDVPVRVGPNIIHVLASHPTPPAFDGPEDRNGRRNHDEIRFWSDYLSGTTAQYARDDQGSRSPFTAPHFVIMGDLNSDPEDAGSRHEAIRGLLSHARVNRGPAPSSAGGVEAAALQGGANATHRGEPRFDTSDFNDRGAGNLRVDYVLPSRSLRICDSGIFWPTRADPQAELLGSPDKPTSDHRLVWVDVSLSGKCVPRR
jgi:endonuclease/exonuclease/phosphatase family metal-dependent hydrolase